MSTGAELIAAERQRHIDLGGMTADRVDLYSSSELLAAADCYFSVVYGEMTSPCYEMEDYVDTHWPWHPDLWEPSPDPVRNLVKAGALIAAEIDRLQRAPGERSQ